LYVRLLLSGVRYRTTTSYYFQKDVCVIALLLFFLHQLTIDEFKQLNMSNVGNGTAGASGIGPASGYNLQLSRLFVVFVLFLYRLSMKTNNLCAAIILLILSNSMIFLLDSGIKIYCKMHKHLTIQKLDCCDRLSVTSFAAALKPNAFDGSNYKQWRDRMILWLTAMNIIHVTKGKTEQFTPEEEQAFTTADNLFRDVVISVLAENLVDFYLTAASGKELWDALETKYGVFDTGSELYVMKQFCDYKMVDDHSIVEQAHEIQSLTKELKGFKCDLPDKFVARCIIAKLPPTWMDFATSLKHKRKEFSIADLIGSLDVEEKARAKDTREKGVVGTSSANVVQKNNFNKSHNNNNKKKNKQENPTKTKQTTNFKKKNKGNCFICGDPSHFTSECENRKWKGNKNQQIWLLAKLLEH
jgi:hypothetical protein